MKSRRHRERGIRFWVASAAAVTAIVAMAIVFGIPVVAQTADPPAPPPLSTVPVPEPSNILDFVKDKQKAIVLGKALFWDMNVGSDAIQSCAACHFHAGADNRARNQLSPGLLRLNADGTPNRDEITTKGFNYTLTAADFPFRLLSDPNNRNSTVLRDTNDIAASQGVLYRKFLSIIPGVNIDVTAFAEDPDGFEINNVNVRRVEPRHTPTVINAVFNFRNFWDGRAQHEFNGVNPFGTRDVHARVYRADTASAEPLAVAVAIPNASLASQAVGPPTNSFEMSADGRTFVNVGEKFAKPMRDSGKKAKPLRPLAQQQVHPEDSVLGPYSRYPMGGLTYPSYTVLIREAFQDKWWNSQWKVKINSDGSRTLCTSCTGSNVYELEEMNFSLFFGLAVQLYEATLISTDTPFDRFVAGDTAAMTLSQQRGLNLFRSQTRGRCINCHAGPALTNASVQAVTAARFRRREGNLMDMGFNNIGVRPTTEDIALGGKDLFGTPLSEARLATQGQFTDPSNVQPPVGPNEVLGVDGAFKVPGIRNVELTAPYFHNGGTLTLRGVIEFYSRGGDFVPITNMNGQTISPLSTPNFTEQEKDDLVNFLLALTDENVRNRRAPFDHPELSFPAGHPGSTTSVNQDLLEPGQAKDRLQRIPAIGRNGAAPLPLFPVP
jgi:cytochrome c peroxidase